MNKDITGFEYKAQEKSMALAKLMNEGVVVEVPAVAFNRSPKRKLKETFVSYKRGMKNMNRAMKMYFKYGPDVKVLINKDTMVVVR